MLYPAIEWLVFLLTNPWVTVIVFLLLAIKVADSIVTLLQLLKLSRKLKELDEITKLMQAGSDAIGHKVADVTLKVEDKVLVAKERLSAHHKKIVDEIVAKMPARLLNAFPTLKSRNNPDAVKIARESVKRRKRNKMNGNSSDNVELVTSTKADNEKEVVNNVDADKDVK